MRAKYWSSSKLAKWVRLKFGDRVKPNALGWDEWVDWDEDFHKKHPFVFWFTEEFLDKVQNVVMSPYDLYNKIRYKFLIRFVDRKYMMDTKLDKWGWYDCDTRILHGLFETLVDFIEVEKSHMMLISDDTIPKHRWYQFTFLRWNRVRSRELGIKHLEWEMSLDSPDLNEYESSPTQAATAREQYALYTWWKDVRPNRPDPYDASGINEIHENREVEATGAERKRSWMRALSHRTEEEKAATKAAYARCAEIETQYLQEDEDMLIRLIKIRRSLWT